MKCRVVLVFAMLVLLCGCARGFASSSGGASAGGGSAAAGSAAVSASRSPSAPSASASSSVSSGRYGHYGEPANSPGPGAYAGWSEDEQRKAVEFAVSSVRVFAMKTDAATWHLYMDPRVTDEYREKLKSYDPQYGTIGAVYSAVYTEFPPDAKKAVVRVGTSNGVWVVHLARGGAGEQPKVSLIEPLTTRKR